MKKKTIFFNDIDFNVDNHIEILNHNLIKKEYFCNLKQLCQSSYIKFYGQEPFAPNKKKKY